MHRLAHDKSKDSENLKEDKQLSLEVRDKVTRLQRTPEPVLTCRVLHLFRGVLGFFIIRKE